MALGGLWRQTEALAMACELSANVNGSVVLHASGRVVGRGDQVTGLGVAFFRH